MSSYSGPGTELERHFVDVVLIDFDREARVLAPCE